MRAFEATVLYGSGTKETHLVICEYISSVNSLVSDKLTYSYNWEITSIVDISKNYENVIFEPPYKHE